MNRLYTKPTAMVVEFKPESPCLIGATNQGADGGEACTRKPTGISDSNNNSFKKNLWED